MTETKLRIAALTLISAILGGCSGGSVPSTPLTFLQSASAHAPNAQPDFSEAGGGGGGAGGGGGMPGVPGGGGGCQHAFTAPQHAIQPATCAVGGGEGGVGHIPRSGGGLIAVAPNHYADVVFRADHFWTQHLANELRCSLQQVEDAIFNDLESRLAANPALFNGVTQSQTFEFTFNDNGTAVMLVYRAFYVVSTNPNVDDFINIGTVYVPDK